MPARPDRGRRGGGRRGPGFRVHLDNFEGPFDLLLGLIAKHKLDVTEVALSKVTDEFIAHIKALGAEWDLEQATEFLVVAATLLDLKAARLLPSGDVEDEEDLALLEARDLLFARLLQYRAYKEVAAVFAGRMADEARRFPRAVGLEDAVREPAARGAARPRAAASSRRWRRGRSTPEAGADGVGSTTCTRRGSASASRPRSLVDRLRRARTDDLPGADRATAPDTLTVVARFLALLELFREGAVAFEQVDAARRAARPLDRQPTRARSTSPTSSTTPRGRRRRRRRRRRADEASRRRRPTRRAHGDRA